MNIKITHSWLLEFLDTEAKPSEIQKYLSLCGPSIERVEKLDHDYVYDIEITSNRIDTASVYGIAQEASVILPQFTIKADLKPLNIKAPQTIINKLSLDIKDEKKLCNRVVSIVMDNVEIKSSPEFITKRLEAAGIRSLNNVIDITNYVMLELGHPTHVMDYDRIKTGKLLLRHAKKNEQLITLDDKKYNLNEKDVVVDDGSGRIIDLPGIMGTSNSVVTNQTKRIVIFIESNNPQTIRQTSMRLGIRTLAVTYDEKNLDPQLTKQVLYRAINLFEKYANAKIASNIIDIYHTPLKTKTINLNLEYVNKFIGVTLNKDLIISILQSLGFKYKLINDRAKLVSFEVPSWRYADVNIQEDLIEEIARVYGYFKLPSILQSQAYVSQPIEIEKLFFYQSKIKYFLKHIGLTEVMNYSMISKDLIINFDDRPKDYLRLSNSISTEIEYLRKSLIPSLVKNIHDNQGKKDKLELFEISKIYIPRKDDLPEEIYKLGVVTNSSYYELKGIIDSLFNELNIDNYKIDNNDYHLFNSNIQGKLSINNLATGVFGELKGKYRLNIEIKGNLFLAEFDLMTLINAAKIMPQYHPITSFSIIKLDLTIVKKLGLNFEKIKKIAFKNSGLLTKIEFVSLFNNKLSLRFYFSSSVCNITEDEAKEELNKIAAAF